MFTIWNVLLANNVIIGKSGGGVILWLRDCTNVEWRI